MELEETLPPYLKENKLMVLTEEEEAQLLAAQVCYICKHPFKEENRKVRDHDHATGAYRGAAHQTCNRQKQRQLLIPIIFHNLRGYDGLLLIQGIHKVEKKKLDCIPNNMERYISFSVSKLQFIDSYQFMASSLETLVHNLDDMSSPT